MENKKIRVAITHGDTKHSSLPSIVLKRHATDG